MCALPFCVDLLPCIQLSAIADIARFTAPGAVLSRSVETCVPLVYFVILVWSLNIYTFGPIGDLFSRSGVDVIGCSTSNSLRAVSWALS